MSEDRRIDTTIPPWNTMPSADPKQPTYPGANLEVIVPLQVITGRWWENPHDVSLEEAEGGTVQVRLSSQWTPGLGWGWHLVEKKLGTEEITLSQVRSFCTGIAKELAEVAPKGIDFVLLAFNVGKRDEENGATVLSSYFATLPRTITIPILESMIAKLSNGEDT